MFKYDLLCKFFGSVLLIFFLTGSNSLFAQNGTVGDRVWFDANANGLQDAGENGLANVWVFLQTPGGADLDFDITDSNGNYSFSVAPGTYRLKFANPGGFVPSPQDAGSDNSDNDQDFLGFTAPFTISAGQTNNNMDGGFMPIPAPCSLTAEIVDTICLSQANDSYIIILIITGGGPWGWTASNGQTGYYGDPATFGPYSGADGPVCLDFVDMDNPTCVGDICVDPPECPPCDPVTYGGKIGNSESRCGPYNPAPIINLEGPQGGSGNIEYMWFASKDGCFLFDMSDRIFGADGPTYDPPVIYQTMYYQRWARRDDCPMWTMGHSNCVVKEVLTDPAECGPICESRMVMNANANCGSGGEYSIHFPDALLGLEQTDYSAYWHITEGLMTELENGTAKVQARLKNNLNTDMFLDLELNLSGRTFHPQPGSPVASGCYDINDSDWYYYKDMSGSLTGHGALEGGLINLSQNGSDFQAGTGANGLNGILNGARMDFNYTVASQPDSDITFYKETTMTFAATLTGGINNCIPDGAACCENDNVLFIVGDLDLDDSDVAVRSRLQSRGFDVDLQIDYKAQPWDAMGYGLVVISSTASSPHINGTFADVPVPVLNYEAWVHDDMYMAQGGSQTQLGLDWGKYINVTNDGHPISIGRTGQFKVYNMSRPLSWGMPMGDGVGVAIPGTSVGKYGMFAYDEGDVMVDGNIALARRVGFFLGNESAHYMTDDGWMFFDASVTWAIDCRLSTMTFPIAGFDGNPNEDELGLNVSSLKDINIYPNPTNGDIFFDLSAYEGEAMTITIYNQIGQAVKFIRVDESYGVMNADLSELNNGYHLVQFETATEGTVATKKLLIRR